MPAVPSFSSFDPALAVEAIITGLRHQVGTVLRRSGGVVALSGGIDSAVCAALAVAAFGPSRVVGLALPERESDPESLSLARALADSLGIHLEVEDLTTLLEGSGCYARRDAAIARVTPFPPGARCKLQVDTGAGAGHLPLCYVVVRSADGSERRVRVPPREFREIVAASNYKQRARAMVTYHHADRLHAAVIGTPNRLEYRLGFFVKGGDGLADVKPIAHLYKTEVYRLADHLGVPAAIRDRVPTTDTYSLPQTQEEFFFALPLLELDQLLCAYEGGADPITAAAVVGHSPEEVGRIFAELERKIRAAEYLHAPALLVAHPGEGAPVPAGLVD